MDAPEPAERARLAERAGDLPAAARDWRALYEAEGDVRWALRLAIALARADRDDEAEQLYDEAATAAAERGDHTPALVAALAGQLPDIAERFAGSDVPLLGHLTAEDFAALLPSLSRRALAPGEVLIQEGTRADALYLLAEGTLAVVRSDEKAGELSLGVLTAGAVVGEMALVLDQPRTASVRAIDEVETVRIELDGLRDAAARVPNIEHALDRFAELRLINAVVGTSPLLRTIAPSQRDQLVPEFTTVEVPAGVPLMTQDQPGDGVYVLVSGAARVTRKDGERDAQLALLGPGQVFGEISLLSDGPATATVTTTEDSVLKHLDAAAFDALCGEHPSVRAQLARLGNDRLVEIRFIFEDDEFIEAAD